MNSCSNEMPIAGAETAADGADVSAAWRGDRGSSGSPMP